MLMTTGPIRNRAVYETIRALKVGEELMIKRSEWRALTLPPAALLNAGYRGQFDVRWLADGDGWLVVRVREAPPGKEQHHGPVVTRAIYEQIRSLRIGEKFTLAKSEWRVATSPMESIGKSARYRDRIIVRPLEHGEGWLISRVR
jgi:hypothetical protein